jgi:hypothetical protein
VITLLLACAEPPAPVLAPDAQSWKEEAELVVEGLEAVEALWNEGQKSAAGTMAERVYTERFEPRIEPALREMEGPEAAATVEYAFGQLRVVLDGKDRARVEASINELERRARAIGEAAERAFPPPGEAPKPPPPPKDVRPLVPDVPPAWELGDGEKPEAETPPG